MRQEDVLQVQQEQEQEQKQEQERQQQQQEQQQHHQQQAAQKCDKKKCYLRACAEHINNTHAHTTIDNPYGIAGVRSSTIYTILYVYIIYVFTQWWLNAIYWNIMVI